MNLTFLNKRISGVLTVLPDNYVKFEDEMIFYNFPTEKSLKLKQAMGYNTHCIVKEGTTTSDLCIFGLNHLIEKGLLLRDEIDALILITQSPDYIMPPTSSVIHGKMNLKQDIFCMDINQGCAGYIIGLFQAFLLLEQPTIRKVILLNADILSRKVSKYDRNSNPLIGDGASVTVVERSPIDCRLSGYIKMDGKGYDALIIAAGGFKHPSDRSTEEMIQDQFGNLRSLNNLTMKGDEVFNFVQKEVPPMINHLLSTAGVPAEEIDYYLFHQPNKFMLNKLADKLGIPREKMPNNIVENFGNASSVSIPTVISFNLGHDLIKQSYTVCLAGFGVGLTWASLVMKIGNLSFNEMIYFK